MATTRRRRSRSRRRRRRLSRRRRQRVEQLTGAVAAVVATAVALSVLAGVLSDGAWPWVLATYLRWPQVLVSVVATGVLFASRWWRTGIAAAVVTVALIASIAAPLRALTTVPTPESETLRIAVFNTGPGPGDVPAVAEAVAQARPDVAVLLESEDIADRLDERLDGLSRLPTPTDGPVTSPPVVLARRDWPVTIAPLGDARPASIVTARIAAQPVDIVALHPLPPITPQWARSHDTSIRALTEAVLPREHPYVVACDCNTSPWTPSMQPLLEVGLREPTVAATFGAPAIGVPTDHVLLSRDVAAVSRELGPWAGSDHRLIVTEVTLRS